MCLLVKLYQFLTLLDKLQLQRGGAETVHHELHQLVPSSPCPTQHRRLDCQGRRTRWSWWGWSPFQGVSPSVLPVVLAPTLRVEGRVRMPIHLAVAAIQRSGCYLALRTLESPLYRRFGKIPSPSAIAPSPTSYPKIQAHLGHHTTWRYMTNELTAQ